MSVAVVTGVGRTSAIAFAVTRRLLGDGFDVVISAHPEADPDGWSEVVDALQAPRGRLEAVEADLERPDAPRRLLERAVERFGGVDAVVAAHARSSNYTLDELTADELDRTWAINARASVLLVQALAALHDDARGGGRAVLFTSGQHIGPMAGEIPYAISKGAIHQMTKTLADAVADRRITVNTINPGPVDTGWPDAELKERLTPAFPAGRWGLSTDIAPVVGWLLSPESAWMTGHVLDVEGGFRRGP
jgi:NAD(P)-dependent dehydrogenase (short-subunit alcohol dehydrogenase family)